MAVTFASAGYGGAVTQESWATLATKLGHTYAVEDEGSWEVAPANGDRAVTVAAGGGYGYGVQDRTTASESLFLPAVTSGTTRYDLIVARRDWATKKTSFAIVQGTGSKRIPSRTNNPGIQDEQPIALVRVSAGSTAINEVVDLRVWSGNGGMFCKDDLVRSYLDRIGTQISVSDVRWELQINADTDAAAWVKVSELGKIPLFAAGGSLLGSAAAGTQFLVQAGTIVQSTDGQGYGRITWPKPFPNGVLTVILTSGDDWGAGRIAFFNVAGRPDVFGASAYGSKTDVVYVMEGSDSRGDVWGKLSGRTHRLNYIVIGW